MRVPPRSRKVGPCASSQPWAGSACLPTAVAWMEVPPNSCGLDVGAPTTVGWMRVPPHSRGPTGAWPVGQAPPVWSTLVLLPPRPPRHARPVEQRQVGGGGVAPSSSLPAPRTGCCCDRPTRRAYTYVCCSWAFSSPSGVHPHLYMRLKRHRAGRLHDTHPSPVPTPDHQPFRDGDCMTFSSRTCGCHEL